MSENADNNILVSPAAGRTGGGGGGGGGGGTPSKKKPTTVPHAPTLHTSLRKNLAHQNCLCAYQAPLTFSPDTSLSQRSLVHKPQAHASEQHVHHHHIPHAHSPFHQCEAHGAMVHMVDSSAAEGLVDFLSLHKKDAATQTVASISTIIGRLHSELVLVRGLLDVESIPRNVVRLQHLEAALTVLLGQHGSAEANEAPDQPDLANGTHTDILLSPQHITPRSKKRMSHIRMSVVHQPDTLTSVLPTVTETTPPVSPTAHAAGVVIEPSLPGPSQSMQSANPLVASPLAPASSSCTASNTVTAVKDDAKVETGMVLTAATVVMVVHASDDNAEVAMSIQPNSHDAGNVSATPTRASSCPVLPSLTSPPSFGTETTVDTVAFHDESKVDDVAAADHTSVPASVETDLVGTAPRSPEHAVLRFVRLEPDSSFVSSPMVAMQPCRVQITQVHNISPLACTEVCVLQSPAVDPVISPPLAMDADTLLESKHDMDDDEIASQSIRMQLLPAPIPMMVESRLLTGKNKCTAVIDSIPEPEQLAFECVHSPSLVLGPRVQPAHVSLGTTTRAALATSSVTWSALPDSNLCVEACYLPVSPRVESKTTTCSCQAQQALIQEQSQIIQGLTLRCDRLSLAIPTRVFKFHSNGKSDVRFLQLSDDSTLMRWSSRADMLWASSAPLSEIVCLLDPNSQSHSEWKGFTVAATQTRTLVVQFRARLLWVVFDSVDVCQRWRSFVEKTVRP